MSGSQNISSSESSFARDLYRKTQSTEIYHKYIADDANFDSLDSSSSESFFSKCFNQRSSNEQARNIEASYESNSLTITESFSTFTQFQDIQNFSNNQNNLEENQEQSKIDPKLLNSGSTLDTLTISNNAPKSNNEEAKVSTNSNLNQLIINITKNLNEIHSKIISLHPESIKLKSKSNQICEYLFNSRRDKIGIRFTRAHNRMLRNVEKDSCCLNKKLLHYIDYKNQLFIDFNKYYLTNKDILEKECKFNEKLTTTLFNSDYWKKYFSIEVVIKSFHLCIDYIFSEVDKDVLNKRILNEDIELDGGKKLVGKRKNFKNEGEMEVGIEDSSKGTSGRGISQGDLGCDEIWELRKRFLKDLLFIIN